MRRKKGVHALVLLSHVLNYKLRPSSKLCALVAPSKLEPHKWPLYEHARLGAHKNAALASQKTRKTGREGSREGKQGGKGNRQEQKKHSSW